MTPATFTSKGQVTIPVEVRNELGLSAGDRIKLILNDTTGRYEVLPVNLSVKALKGIIAKPGRPVRREEMNAAIAEQIFAANAAADFAK
jgi:antitoxin PrlF